MLHCNTVVTCGQHAIHVLLATSVYHGTIGFYFLFSQKKCMNGCIVMCWCCNEDATCFQHVTPMLQLSMSFPLQMHLSALHNAHLRECFFLFFVHWEQWGWVASPISYHQCYAPLHCGFKGPLFSRVCCKMEISNSHIAPKTFKLIELVQATGSDYPATFILKNARPQEFFELSGISKYPT